MLTDRLPPQNLAAEQGVIGAMLIDPACIDDIRLVMRADDLYRDTHQAIVRRIFALADAARPVDTITVAEELRRHGEYERIGGDEALAEILRQTPHAANAVYHAQIVEQLSRKRAVIEAANEMLRDGYSDDLTADEVTERAASRVFAIEERSAGAEPSELIGPAAIEAFDVFCRRSDGELTGLPTGLHELDSVLDGFQPGYLNIVAARPSMGKSLVALQFARHAAMGLKVPVVFFSLEMPKRDLASRLMVSMSRVSGHKIQTGKPLDAAETAAWGRAYEAARTCSTFWVKQANRLTPEKVMAEARRLKRRHGLGLVVIDYLQLLDPPADLSRRAPRHEQVAAVTRRLKTAAMDLDIPIVLLAQLNREAEKREGNRPRVADLRESGAVEQDADVILLLHRPGEYDPGIPPGHLDLIVGKNRNGPKRTLEYSIRMECGVVEPRFDPIIGDATF